MFVVKNLETFFLQTFCFLPDLNQKPKLINFQAFAWFSDLIVEHAEIFWSLFAVDMDRILAEQPPDTWDSFPLFQILNDYLRTDGKFLLLMHPQIEIRISCICCR